MKGSRFLAGLLSGCLVFSSMPVMAAEPESGITAENPGIPSEKVGLGGQSSQITKMR
jgi:hypothetical protein